MPSLWESWRRALRPASSASAPPVLTNGAALPGPDDSGWPRAGGRLGAFQLQAEIGRGTVGRVYRATEDGRATPVALKTLALAQEFRGQALNEARARFFRQADAARRLSHPDIVPLLDCGECNGVAWLAMPLLNGQSLACHVQANTLLGVPEVMSIGARVARALAHAHAQGVVHRDVKPANIMVDLAAGAVTVTDFGIAHLTDAAATRTGLVLGSPAYMSPEQLAGRRVDGRSDLYALGVTLYQLLTARLPHASHRLSDLLSQIANDVAPDVRHLRADVPEALAHVLSLALEKRPELRYADGLQLAEDLDAVAAQLARARVDQTTSGPPKLASAKDAGHA